MRYFTKYRVQAAGRLSIVDPRGEQLKEEQGAESITSVAVPQREDW